CSADESLLGIEIVREPGVARPRPPERGEHEHAVPDPRPGRGVGKERRDLREREDEDEVEEELARRDAVLVVDGQRGHFAATLRRLRPLRGCGMTQKGEAGIMRKLLFTALAVAGITAALVPGHARAVRAQAQPNTYVVLYGSDASMASARM